MSYPITHVLVELEARTTIRGDGDVATARFAASGPLDVSFPGRMVAWASAAYFVRVEDDQGPAQSQRRTLQLTTAILTPDGEPFAADEVTVDDLRRFRDLRGVPVGPWTYRVVGESAPVPLEGGVRLVPSEAHVRIRLHEVVHSSSAPPLIDTTVPAERLATLPFDLFHVGTLEVTASPGPPVTAIALDDDRVAVFVADAGGGVFTAAGNVVPGWGPWADVSQGATVPGGTVSACPLGDGRIAVFVADPGGGVYAAVGSPDVGFGPWDAVAQGSTMPGAPICAVPLGSGLVRLAVADRAGGVYSIVGTPGRQEWGEWRPVSEGATVPGGAITGVRTEDGRVHLFLADVAGGVYTASCSHDGVWSAWSPVAEGSTTPGGWVTSVLSQTGRIRVFLADRAGGVYGASRRDEPTWGMWSEVPGVSASPGAKVAALPDEDDTVRLILADRYGAVRSTVGSASRQWSPWEHVSEGATMPGAPIGAARHGSGRVSLVSADLGFGVFGVTRTGDRWSTWRTVSQGTAGGQPRTVTLRDPDGLIIASSATGSLAMPVDLPLLDRSRDSLGGIRTWTLEVTPAAPMPTGPPVPVLAQVVASTRLDLGQVRDRIHELLGPDGEKVALEGDTTAGRARLRLTVLDRASAATLDFHGILDPVLDGVEQDAGAPTDLREGVPFSVIDVSASLGYGVELDLDALRVTALRVDLGASVHLSGVLPALRVEVAVEGEAVARIAGFPLATARVRGGQVSFEIGLRLGPDGEFASDTWISGAGSLIDVDVHWAAALAAGVVSPAGALTAALVLELVESSMNDLITSKVQRLAAGGLRGVRHAFARFLGGDFTYLSIGIDADDLVLAYLAAIEQQPTPSPIYRPVNGRPVDQVDGRWQVAPDERGDTWASDRLRDKIDHIVMVMMENRSYDHVLGRHAVGEGLDDQVLALLAGVGSPARHLASSRITPNGVGLRTRFPAPVGHSLADVTEQLSGRATLPSGREVNAPTGFLSNFRKRLERQPDEVKAQLDVANVLGYYTTDDLMFFRHLTSHYAWSDRFYCSHPGPTLPNRMLSLVGDLQYTRSGEAVLDNNHGEEFYLSRAMTIFDLLTRRGLDWRVYESFPSVTMLRMFARYAGDRDRIFRFERFADDVLTGDLPPFTVVDPAMHHKPQTDDHPVADMYRGQQFLDSVYRALRANERVWQRTLLLITYDEHGGFYDHVVPPVAEILDDGSSSVVTPYGVRVPTFVVSPWVPAGPGPRVVLDHCSILKTVLARFCADTRPFLSDRVHAASSFEDFLTEPVPRLDVPMPPPLPPLPDDEALYRIVTDPVFRRDMRLGNVDYHDLTGMLARSLGRDTGQS